MAEKTNMAIDTTATLGQAKEINPGQAPLKANGAPHDRSLLDAIRTETAPEATSFFMFFADNAKVLVMFFCLFILVLVGFGLFNYTANTSLANAKNELGNILQNADESKKSQALQDFLAKAPAGALVPAYLALAQSYEAQADYAKAAEAWAKVSSVSVEPMKTQAIIGEAQALSLSDNAAKALTLVDGLLAKVSKESMYFVSLNMLAADLAERTGDKGKASTASKAVLNNERTQDKVYWQKRIERLESPAQ